MGEQLITSIQAALRDERIDGWLFCSFRGSDAISESILGIDRTRMFTRRWFYFVPAEGEPQRIVHAIETGALDGLPGRQRVYLPWSDLHDHLRQAMSGACKVAMQYSPMNAIPYISRADAGTVELVRSFGIEVVSSGDLVQMFEAVWTSEQLETHLYAAKHMREIVDVTFAEVARRIRSGVPTTEVDVQDFIWDQYASRGLTSTHRPIVAVNAHSADPHYIPDRDHNAAVRAGDFLLLDIWSKKAVPHSVYDDITWTGFVGESVPPEHARIFGVVRNGRDAAIHAVQSTYPRETMFGWQVDDASRMSICGAGYGEYFIHRTGHSIHEEDHGNGANMDNLETRDNRRLMARTCFSVEPGVYLPGKFGIRSEVNVYLADTEAIVTGGPIQDRVVAILGH